MKPEESDKLAKTLRAAHVWTLTTTLLSLFCCLCFVLFMWTFAAFGAIFFAIQSVFWIVLKQTTAIRLEIRK